MDNLKQQVQRQLVANVIKDKCAHKDDIIFMESWCTQERCIRFTLPIFRALFPPQQNCGGWDDGDFVMFEVNNDRDNFEITCVFSSKGLHKECFCDRDALLNSFSASSDGVIWRKGIKNATPNDIFNFFDAFLSNDLEILENKILKSFLSSQDEMLEEGAVKRITSSRYERNRKARDLCLAYYGKACKKCGLNFGETYSSEYADLVEVHHIVPLCEIGESYIVNPIKDLIPICPNCHAMLHCQLKCDNT